MSLKPPPECSAFNSPPTKSMDLWLYKIEQSPIRLCCISAADTVIFFAWAYRKVYLVTLAIKSVKTLGFCMPKLLAVMTMCNFFYFSEELYSNCYIFSKIWYFIYRCYCLLDADQQKKKDKAVLLILVFAIILYQESWAFSGSASFKSSIGIAWWRFFVTAQNAHSFRIWCVQICDEVSVAGYGWPFFGQQIMLCICSRWL